jgi:putative ABC transport system ATP-binding protein
MMFNFGKQATVSSASSKSAGDAASRPVVDLRRVEKTYRSAAGVFVALDGVDFQVQPGQFVSIIGKSGSGKSTLINMITGIDRPTAGELRVGGTDLDTLSEEEIALWRGETIGIIFQFFQLLPGLTAVENVMLPMDYARSVPRSQRPERAMQLLQKVGMGDAPHRLPAQLSGGEQQRVAIARALANDPPLLAADEPTGNLDSKAATAVLALFEELAMQGKTILMVTHDKDLAERAQFTVELADGQIIDQWSNR